MNANLVKAIEQAAVLIAPHMPPVDPLIAALYGGSEEAEAASNRADVASISIRIRKALEVEGNSLTLNGRQTGEQNDKSGSE